MKHAGKYLYLAGPMTGKPLQNGQRFMQYATALRRRGYHIVSPWEHDILLGLDPSQPKMWSGKQRHASMRWDLLQILRQGCAGVVLLEGWRRSPGALVECLVAQACGLPCYEVADLERGRLRLVRVHMSCTVKVKP